ncbi:hypothetical protein QQG55_50535 [Brugia pahangi]
MKQALKEEFKREEGIQKLGEKETTYMEASVSPSAGTGLPGLGLSMTPFSIPESSVSMKSTVSANETGVGRKDSREKKEYKKLEKEKLDIYGSFSITISWHWAAWSWSIDDTLLYT